MAINSRKYGHRKPILIVCFFTLGGAELGIVVKRTEKNNTEAHDAI